MHIFINGRAVSIEASRESGYSDIVALSGMPPRDDYSMTCKPIGKEGFIAHKHTCFMLEDGMNFNIALTGAA